MKKIAYIAFALGIFIVSRPIFAEEGPPAIQTPEKDASMKEETEQKPPQTLRKRIVISPDGTITIYYEAGGNSQNPQNTKRAEDEKRRAQERRIGEIFDNATKLGLAEHGDLLSDNVMLEIDALMLEYLHIIRENPPLIDWLNMLPRIGLSGDRYISSVENVLSHLPTREVINFYEKYLTSTMARTEDYPSEKTKNRAIQIMKELIFASDENNFIITHEMAEEIQRIDPETYESLHKDGKIIF